VNVDNKSEPYLPNYMSPSQIETMANDWGFNLVRLDFAWAAYEPTQGNKSMTYLQEFKAIIDQFASYGIWSLIDMHQDEYTRNWCGEGFPGWSAIVSSEWLGTFPLPEYYSPYPLNSEGNGVEPQYCIDIGNNGLYYFSYLTSNVFQNFYNNTEGVQDAFINMFASLGQMFNQNSNVFGYEIINEPFPGSLYEDFDLFLNSTYGDLVNLQPLYDQVSEALRQYDQNGLLLFEPLVSNGEVLARKAGFEHPPGPLSVLSFHVYCDVTESYAYDCVLAGPEYAADCNDILDGDPEYCSILFEQDFAVRTSDALSLGVPMIVTEFGSWTGNTTHDANVNQFICDLADVNFTSWTNWDILNIWEYPDLIPVLSRVYVQAVAGKPLNQTWNPQTGVYNLFYYINTEIWAPTEIFVPVRIHFPTGFSVLTSPSVKWTRRGGIVQIIPTTAQNGELIFVQISPKVY